MPAHRSLKSFEDENAELIYQGLFVTNPMHCYKGNPSKLPWVCIV